VVISPHPHWEELYPEVFSEEVFNHLPELRPGKDLAIKLKPDAKPWSSKIYLLTHEQCEKLDEWLQSNLTTGRICPSTLAFSSPVFFKQEGTKL
jgi:hypothetical protein